MMFGQGSTPNAGQDGPEFRCGFVDFVVGVGFGDDAATGMRVGRAPVGGQLRAPDRHHPAAVAALRRTSRPLPRRSRGRPPVRRSARLAAAVGTPPTAGVGCSASARSSAVVDVSRSRPVIGRAQVPHRRGAVSCGSCGDLQVGAQRVQRLAHRVDDELVLVAVLGGFGQGRAVGSVGVGVGRAAGPSRRTAGTSPARRGGRPAVPGWRRRARRRSSRHRPADRSARYVLAARRRRPAAAATVRASSGASATNRSARASTTFCRPAAGSSAAAAALRPTRAAVLVGVGQRLRRSAPVGSGRSRPVRQGVGERSPPAGASAPPALESQKARRPR